MALADYEVLGSIGDKTYFLCLNPDLKDDVTGESLLGQVCWEVPPVREAIVASPGRRIAAADYSQIEVRLMAHLSRDPWLISAINSGKDIHCFLAADVNGVDYDLLYTACKNDDHPRHKEMKKLRNDTKCVTFGIPYGAGAMMVAGRTGKTPDEAQDLIDRYMSKAKVLKLWLEQQGQFAIKWGYTASARGRRRHYEVPNSDDPNAKEVMAQIERWAKNHPVQSSNVDMLKPALVSLYKALRGGAFNGPKLYDASVLFVVHDEIVMEAAEHLLPTMEEKIARGYDEVLGKKDPAYKYSWAGPVEKLMIDAMQASYDAIIPDIIHSTDVAIGPRWDKV